MVSLWHILPICSAVCEDVSGPVHWQAFSNYLGILGGIRFSSGYSLEIAWKSFMTWGVIHSVISRKCPLGISISSPQFL